MPFPNIDTSSDKESPLHKKNESSSASLEQFTFDTDGPSKLYEITLRHGEKITLNRNELNELFVTFQDAVIDYLNEKKTCSTEVEYNEIVIKYLELVKM